MARYIVLTTITCIQKKKMRGWGFGQSYKTSERNAFPNGHSKHHGTLAQYNDKLQFFSNCINLASKQTSMA